MPPSLRHSVDLRSTPIYRLLPQAVTPAAAAAQLADAGASLSVSYAQYDDVPRQCCPPLVWATLGSGRFRLHVDYLRSYREAEGYGSFSIDGVDGVDGRRAYVQRGELSFDPRHEASVLVSWRALEHPRYRLNILFGGVYAYSRVAFCWASEGPVVRIPTPADWPPDYVVFRQELTPAERGRCPDGTYTNKRIGPQAGAVLDVPLGERFFFRASTRLWLRAGVGVGVKF